MANYTPPASFSISQAPSSTLLPTDISPSTLDTLPILTTILARLQTGTTNSTSTTTTAQTSQSVLPPQNGSPHISQSHSLQTTAAGSISSPFPSSTAHNNKEHLHSGPLTTKDIPAETDELKAGLKRARIQVAGLPDMERSVEEQEVEIQELESKIREQRRVLEGLKAMGADAKLGTWCAGK